MKPLLFPSAQSFADDYFNPCPRGIPTLCYGDEDGGGGGDPGGGDGGGTAVAEAPVSESTPEGAPEPGEQPIRASNHVDRITNERDQTTTKAPDFSTLGKKPAAAVKPDTKPLETGIQPEKGERARGADGKFIKTAAEKQAEAEAQKPASTVQAPKPEAAQPEAKKAPPEAAKKALPTPEEIDKLELPPGSSEKAVTNFGQMRAQLKEAVSAVKEHAAKLATLEAENKALKENGADPEKLKAYEEDRKFRELWEAGNHPKFQAEWTQKAESAKTNLVNWLKNEQLPEASLKIIQEKGIDSPEGRAILAECDKAYAAANFTLERHQLAQLALAIRNVDQEKAAALKQLETDREAFVGKIREREQAETNQWIKTAEDASKKLVEEKGYKWAMQMRHQDGETPEQKALVDAHNARFAEMEGQFKEKIGKLYQKDPATMMEVLHSHFDAAEKARELETIKAELAEAQKRIQELSSHAAAVRKAGRVGSVESGASPEASSRSTTPDPEKVGGDGRLAVANFFDRK